MGVMRRYECRAECVCEGTADAATLWRDVQISVGEHSMMRGSHVEPSSDLTQVLNNVWSDNADEMSLLYSSSRSLKTDYTR